MNLEAARIASLLVGGSIIAGTESGGGTLIDSGALRVFFDIGAITIKGSLLGNVSTPVLITARGQTSPAPPPTWPSRASASAAASSSLKSSPATTKPTSPPG